MHYCPGNKAASGLGLRRVYFGLKSEPNIIEYLTQRSELIWIKCSRRSRASHLPPLTHTQHANDGACEGDGTSRNPCGSVQVQPIWTRGGEHAEPTLSHRVLLTAAI